jgi:hypothetical protein
MLEVPAIAMIIVSVLAFDRYLERPSFRRAAIAGFLLGCMLLLKQTTIIILPALLTYALITKRGRLLWRWEAALPYVIVGIVGILLTLHALKFGSTPVRALADQFGSNRAELLTMKRWEHFWLALRDVSGLGLAIAVLAGGVSCLVVRGKTGGRPQEILLFLWIGPHIYLRRS